MSLPESLQKYIVEKGLFCIPLTMLPSLVSFALGRSYSATLHDLFTGPDAEFLLPVFRSNVTLVPPIGRSNEFFGPRYSLPSFYISMCATFIGLSWLLWNVSLAFLIFKPSRAGKIISGSYCALVTVFMQSTFVSLTQKQTHTGEGFEEASGIPELFAVICIVFSGPVLLTITKAFPSNQQQRQQQQKQQQKYGLCRLFVVASIWTGFTFVVIFSYVKLMELFCRADSSLMQRMMIRCVLHAILVAFVTSGSAFYSHILTKGFQVHPNDASLVFVDFAIITAFYGRLMQTSAETVLGALLLDFAGTVAEIFAMDGLLRGKTPIQELRELAFSLLKKSIIDEDKIVPAEGGVTPSITRKASKAIFCGDAIIIHSLCEAASLVVCTVSQRCNILNVSTQASNLALRCPR